MFCKWFRTHMRRFRRIINANSSRTHIFCKMHLYVAAMEEPEKFAPTLHVAIEEKLPWLKLADGLPTSIGPDYTKARV